MVEKMKLVRVQGTLPQLNDFLDACCMDGRFDLEPATRYMSDSLGYAALNEENPYPATRDQIETMAKEAGMELHKEQRHTDPAGPAEALRGRHRPVQPLPEPESKCG